MKKFLSILLGVTLAVGLVGFTACGEEAETPDPIHGFEGIFSEKSYENEQDAVQALEGEFSGDVYKIDIKKYSHESSISKKSIKELNRDKLDEDDRVVSGKKVKVTYTSTAEKTSSGASSVEEEETFFSAKVFETKEDGDKRFRYYIDCADYDGMISKSYFEYLVTAEPENFTYTTSTSMSIEMMGERKSESEEMTVKCDGDRMIVEIGEESAYLEKEDGEVKVWKKTAEGYEKVTDLTLAGVDLGKYFEDGVENEEFDGFDQTCFIPSETGIVINEGGKGVFLKKLEEELGEDMGSYSGLISLDGEISFDIDTQDGVPMKVEIKATVSASILGFTMNEAVEGKFEVTDVGTTVVETPEGIE